MNEKSELINKLKNNKKTRESYVRAKISINLPSQIRALRLRQKMKQEDLAQEAEMKQPRISAMERPGATKFNVETLIRLAAAFKIGLVVKFTSYNEMLNWENEFSQDTFDVIKIDDDVEFQREGQQPAAIASKKPAILRERGIAQKNFRNYIGEEKKTPTTGISALTRSEFKIPKLKSFGEAPKPSRPRLFEFSQLAGVPRS